MPTDLITPRGWRLAKYELVRLLIVWGSGAFVGMATTGVLWDVTPAALPVGVVIGACLGALINVVRFDPNSVRRGPSLRRARVSERVFLVAVIFALALSTAAWSVRHALGADVTLCVVALTGALLGHVLWRSHPAHTVLGRSVDAARRNPRALLLGIAGALLVSGGFAAGGFEIAGLPLALPCGLIVLAASVTPRWRAAKNAGQTMSHIRDALAAAAKDHSLDVTVDLDSFDKPAEIRFKMPDRFTAAQEEQIKEVNRTGFSSYVFPWPASAGWGDSSAA